MTSKKFTSIKGGKKVLEEKLVVALFEGDYDELSKITQQLNLTSADTPPKLELVKNSHSKPINR